MQSGDGSGERQLVGTAGVDATEQWIDETVHHLVAEPRTDQRANGDVLTRHQQRTAVIGVAVFDVDQVADRGRIGRPWSRTRKVSAPVSTASPTNGSVQIFPPSR